MSTHTQQLISLLTLTGFIFSGISPGVVYANTEPATSTATEVTETVNEEGTDQSKNIDADSGEENTEPEQSNTENDSADTEEADEPSQNENEKDQDQPDQEVAGDDPQNPDNEGTTEPTIDTTNNENSDQNKNPDQQNATQHNNPSDAKTTNDADSENNTESSSAEGDNQPQTSEETEIDNSNTADVTNEAEANAETGDNTAEGEGNTYVETGASYAALNIVNILNSNIVNSDGLILFLSSLYGGDNGTLDLRDYGFLNDSEDGTTTCEETACSDSSLAINNSNDTAITNDVTVGASSGGNSATSEDGDAGVSTGDAYASANVINIANTNIVDSDYLILTFQSFGDWSGDVVFPAADRLEELLGGEPNNADVDIENDSTAVVDNSTDVTADTGNNTASSENGEANVETGDASTNTNIFNQLNSNIFGSGNFSVIFRVHGDWMGDVFSLPEGVTYEQDESGLMFLNDSGETDSSLDSLVTNSVTINNESDAEIKNNLVVTAVSGENSVEADGDANISTGDAYASANVTNIANTNIVGKNWVLAIIDIFGDWDGDVSFGQPDLWIGEQIQTDGRATNGSELTYTFTVMNNGDTAATEVTVSDSFDSEHIEFLDSNMDASVEDEQIIWELGSLEPGETKEITYEARIKDADYGETEIANTVSVEGHEPDEDMTDNTDTASVIAYVRPPSRGFQKIETTELLDEKYTPLEIEVTNTNNAPELITEETAVTYTIKLHNESEDSAHDVVLTDEIENLSGETIHTERFELGEVKSNEEITIEYTVVYDETFGTGVFTNTAQATALGPNDTRQTSEAAVGTVVIIGSDTPATPTEEPAVEPPRAPQIETDTPPQETDLSFVPAAEAASYSLSPGTTAPEPSTNTASVGNFGGQLAIVVSAVTILLLLGYETIRRRDIG